jgi:hypothetical protein
MRVDVLGVLGDIVVEPRHLEQAGAILRESWNAALSPPELVMRIPLPG